MGKSKKNIKKILNGKISLTPLSLIALFAVIILPCILLVVSFLVLPGKTELRLDYDCVDGCIDDPDGTIVESSDDVGASGDIVDYGDQNTESKTKSESQVANGRDNEKSTNNATSSKKEIVGDTGSKKRTNNRNTEESNNQASQSVSVKSIRINEYPMHNGLYMYGDDEADIELTVFPQNATYNDSEIEWHVVVQGGDEKCARIINGKLHVMARYCTKSPFVQASLHGKTDSRSIPIEQPLIITQTWNSANTLSCDDMKQGSTCLCEKGDQISFKTNLDGVIWTVTDEYRGGAVPEYSIYAKYSGTADGVSGSVSKVQVKSMRSSQSLTFYIKIR